MLGKFIDIGLSVWYSRYKQREKRKTGLKVIFEMAANSHERRRVRWEGKLSLESHMKNNRIEK